jgi:ParB/RepB/Spo0J family partition protein
MAGDTRFGMLQLDAITPSKTNPRQTFDRGELEELAASIKEKGICQPILVRPAKAKGTEVRGQYTLVAGERRLRASRLAGLAEIPAMIRDLTDHEACEVQVIENDQRKDVPPLEQAEGYQRLIGHGLDVPAIAAKIGRSESYVTARLQLTHLIDPLKKDVRSGKLPFSHAHLVARLDPAVQKELAGEHRGLYEWGGQPAPLKQLREQIRRTAIRELSAAPWKKDDANLLPAAGSCKDCPKRTGARPGLFDELLNGDGKPGRDFCTDPGCYAKKGEAFVQLQIRTAEEKAGGPLVRVTESWYSNDKSLLTANRYSVVGPKEAKKAKPGELKAAIVMDGGKPGKVIQIRIQKAAGQARRDPSMDRWQVENRVSQRTGIRAAEVAFERLAEGKAKEADVWPALVHSLIGYLGQNVDAALRKILGLGKPAKNDSGRTLIEAIASAPPRRRFAALVAYQLLNSPFSSVRVTGRQGLAASCGVNLGKLKREVRAEMKKPKAKAAAK